METFFEGDSVEIISDTDFDDLDTASNIEFIITKPSGEVALWAATQVDPTDTGYEDYSLQHIKYITEAADLDELGTYRMQAHVEWSTASELHGEIVKFKVKAHLLEA